MGCKPSKPKVSLAKFLLLDGLEEPVARGPVGREG